MQRVAMIARSVVRPCSQRWMQCSSLKIHQFRSFSSASSYQFLTVSQSRNDAVVTIELNRPDVHNAFNEHVIEEITRAFKSSITDTTRVVILRSNGPSFSAGADLSWMKKMKDYTEAENLADSDKLFEMVRSIYQAPVPVVARVQGSALGGGVGLVAACDVALSLKDAKFGLTEVKLGLAPAVISPFVLNKINFTAASRYFLTGERFSAQQAQQFGLVNDVVNTAEELDASIETVIKEILASSPAAVRKTKQLLRELQNETRSSDDLRSRVCSLIAGLRVSPEGQEGVSSFLEKRAPSWRQK